SKRAFKSDAPALKFGLGTQHQRRLQLRPAERAYRRGRVECVGSKKRNAPTDSRRTAIPKREWTRQPICFYRKLSIGIARQCTRNLFHRGSWMVLPYGMAFATCSDGHND